MPKLTLIPFGCQANEADSEKIAGVLAGEGYELTERAEEADLILLNTCSIREKAEQKVYSLLGTFQHLKARNPRLKIGLCGWRAPRGERRPHPAEPLPLYIQSPRPRRESRLKAWVSIMEGCNYLCTFCVVPYTRGPERSRPPHDILAEVRDLVEHGYREITLLGQTVNAYGKNLRPRIRFSDLLRAIDAAAGGTIRVRFTSSHPRDFTPDLVEAIATVPGVCEHVHLPVQAGSNRVLRRMRRLYTREEYMDTIQALTSPGPDIAPSPDVIIGFPGETEDDFRDTLRLLHEVQYDSLFAFKYSPRPLTPAATYSDQVAEALKTERITALLALQDQIALDRNRCRLGTIQEVLIEEGPNPKMGSAATGRTRRNQLVHFSEGSPSPGEIVSSVITEAYSHYLKGKIA